MTASFISDVEKLSSEEKQKFYLLLGNNLTTSIREVVADNYLTEKDKVTYVASINEAIHRALNRVYDLRFGNGSWTEEDIWGMLKHIVQLNPSIKNYLSNAITGSLNAVAPSRP